MSRMPANRPAPLLDPSAILRMCGGRPDVLGRLCEVFRRTVDDHLSRSREALEQGDLPRLRVAAHKLAGTLSAFSTVAGTLASDLEDAAAAGELARCTELFAHLDATCAEVLEETSRLTFETLTG
jgi:HPt (histidine-containing phosphotransfer) domain-containing protein